MKRLIIFIAVLATCAALPAAETKTEILKPTTPEQDSRPNDPAVPEAYALDGAFDRVVILRLKHQADLLAGIERMVKEKNIRNAVILAAIGSVRGYHYHNVSNRTFPSRNIYVKDPEAPADIAGMTGYVINGRVHAHITFSTDKNAFGGHLEAGTPVFTFAAVTLGILADGTDLSRIDDKTHR